MLLALSLTAAAAIRPRISPSRPVDAAALAIIAVMAFQLVPLPTQAIEHLSPAASAFHLRMEFNADPAAPRPLSLDPSRTVIALILAAAALILLVSTRELSHADSRRVARGVAWIGFAAALLGLGGAALMPGGRIYGFWRPVEPGAAPFGAIINRNHFAAWALVAAALSAGIFATQGARHLERAGRRAFSAALADLRILWLGASLLLLTVAIIVTASRSAFVGLVAAGLIALAASWRRSGGRGALLIGVMALVCAAAAAAWARPDRLIARVGVEGGSALGLRAEVWSASADIARAYPIAGVGAGAFPTAMTYYQPPPRDVFFNHAHNQYLEFAAEGGWLLGVPISVFVAGLLVTIAGRIRNDATTFVWVRVGALAGLAGLVTMAVWESPFRTPATLMVAAAAAGLAIVKGPR